MRQESLRSSDGTPLISSLAEVEIDPESLAQEAEARLAGARVMHYTDFQALGSCRWCGRHVFDGPASANAPRFFERSRRLSIPDYVPCNLKRYFAYCLASLHADPGAFRDLYPNGLYFFPL